MQPDKFILQDRDKTRGRKYFIRRTPPSDTTKPFLKPGKTLSTTDAGSDAHTHTFYKSPDTREDQIYKRVYQDKFECMTKEEKTI